MIARLKAMRKGGQTKRFHTERLIGEETVAQHSFGVACLVILLEPAPSVALLKAALFHDIAEQDTGDVPAPVKWKHPELKGLLHRIEEIFHERYSWSLSTNLSVHEETVLKWADSLDLMCTAMEQRMLGNRYMDEVFYKVRDFLNNHQPNSMGRKLLKQLEDEYEQCK